MSRRKRQLKGNAVVNIRFGPGGETEGLECFVCGSEAKPWLDDLKGPASYGVALIEGGPDGDAAVSLCQNCYMSANVSDAIIRKVCNESQQQLDEIVKTLQEGSEATEH